MKWHVRILYRTTKSISVFRRRKSKWNVRREWFTEDSCVDAAHKQEAEHKAISRFRNSLRFRGDVSEERVIWSEDITWRYDNVQD